MVPTIEWCGKHIRMVDQRKIPFQIEWYVCKGYRDTIRAIKGMVIRGAPAIGVAAAMGLSMGASSIRSKSYDMFMRKFKAIAEQMAFARPTAVNLKWACERMVALAEDMPDRPLDEIKLNLRYESEKILSEDIEINHRIGRNGQILVPDRATILTHCNAGSLATAGYGTALGVIRAAHENGKDIDVIADETRPWFQGLRLTAFELMEDEIPVTVIVDSAAGSVMRQKKVDLVITGADRIAANGDVANKIGTYPVAVLARTNNIPFYVAAPLSTIDMSIENGDLIQVEERPPEEVLRFGKRQIGPSGVRISNPSFDITPAKYVTAIITENGIIRPAFSKNIKSIGL